MSAIGEDVELGDWLTPDYSAGGYSVRRARLVISELDGILVFTVPRPYQTIQGTVVKNQHNHWWYYYKDTKDYYPIYLRAHEEIPECYFLTIRKEGSVGLFTGMVSDDFVIPHVNTDPENEQWSTFKFDMCSGNDNFAIQISRSSAGPERPVEFVDRYQSRPKPTKLVYHNKMTKNARDFLDV